ncbi:MAG: HEAT repeat domain-containing protein [Pyrinomonadaceae bacterium MAG19_C2-C3]|nr:HEAT repeat domain-containing protein [Pyrinomonadaceae bacterium MAG19_C2-C3]
MKMTDGLDCVRPQKRFLLLILLICLLVVGANGWQTRRARVTVDNSVHERIAAIISETLKQGELRTYGGVSVITRVPPSNSAVEEVKRYGDAAVPILVNYLQRSENGRERELALRLLGSLGGSRIVAPLREVILYDPSPTFRQLALRWITQAPWKQALPIIQEAAEADRNERVREEAKNLIATRAPK